MKTPTVTVRLHPDLLGLVMADVDAGVYPDRGKAINAMVAEHFGVKNLPKIKRKKRAPKGVKPLETSKGAQQ